LGIFVASLWWKKNNKHTDFTSYTPTLLTSVGILGTFTGIIIGLLDFDTADIKNSIGPLLDGLKTAFITSLVGMLMSIVFKGLVTGRFLTKNQDLGEKQNDVDATDIYQVMQAQLEGVQELKKSISENDETSLVGQMKLLRSDLTDSSKSTNKHLTSMSEGLTTITGSVVAQQENFKAFEDRLWIKLQDFADMMSKSATEQVIEALKQVISDFNNNLTEQFGENFKQLNEAVLKLVEWQDNYKVQLGDMQEKYALGVQAITDTEKSVSSISAEAKAIPEAMSNLKSTLEVNQHQIDELDRHLNAFKDVRDKAVEAVPEIRAQIDQAINGAKEANDVLAKGMQDSATRMGELLIESSGQFKDSVTQSNAALIEASQTTANSSEQIKDQFATALEDINSHTRNLIAELQSGGKELNASYKEVVTNLGSDIKQTSVSFTQGLEEMRTALAGTLEEQAHEGRKQANQILSGMQNVIEDSLKNTGDAVKKQVDMIDQTSEREIENVMNAMGSALTTITNKFTQDYMRLVKQMEQVVNAGSFN